MARIAMIGLGKLGTPTAAMMAAAGHQVIGLDHDPQAVKRFNDREVGKIEPGLRELMLKYPTLKATDSWEEAVGPAEVIYILVPTPSLPDGAFDAQHVLAAATEIGQIIGELDGFKVVAIVSTVMPGTVGGTVLETLERTSGKQAGRDFGLAYTPEFVALGSTLHDLQYPDFAMIGANDPRSATVLAGVARSITDSPIVTLTIIEAEIAKMAVNAYLTMKIGYANLLSELCQAVPDADVLKVARTVGLDSRVGNKYFTPATAAGGPCLARDTRALTRFGQTVGVECVSSMAADVIQSRQAERVGRAFRRANIMPGDAPVGVMGLSYKPGTGVIEGSPAIAIVNSLLAEGHHVVVFDNDVPDDVFARFYASHPVTRAPSAIKLLNQVLGVVLTLPDFAYREDIRQARAADLNPLIIDLWGVLDDHPQVIRLGRQVEQR